MAAREPEQSFALLTPLVQYLAAAQSATVDEAAAHFGVPADRIREAVRLLWVTGVPNSWGDPTMFDFDFDAYEQEDRIEIRYLPALESATVKLSPREAAAILAGLTRLSRIAADDADRIERLAERVRSATAHGRLTVAAQAAQADSVLSEFRQAIERDSAVRFAYRKPGEAPEAREVIPVRLVMADEVTLVVGHDLEREAMRTFRVDRIEAPEQVERPAGVTVPDRHERAALEQITVHATPAAAVSLAPYTSASTPSGDGGRMLSIEVWDLEAVLRAVMATGGEARVTAPESAVAAMGELARTALR